MNLKFLSIELEGFRSIDKAQVILNDQGTVVVKGINEYEDNATSNGSGKSSIFEGIIYSLFEETSSGEKDVENRILSNGFKLRLELEIDGVKYTIYREGKNGKSSVLLYKDNIDISARNKTDTNKLILGLLGISKSIFLDTIFLSQNAVTNLASLQPTARRERLEILTNTDNTINNFKDKIKEQQIKYEADRVDIVNDINQIEGKKSALMNQKSQLNQKIDEINQEIERLKALGDLKQIELDLEAKNKELVEQDLEIDKANQKVVDKGNEIDNLRKDSQDDLDKKAEIDKQLLEVNDQYTRTEASLNRDKLLIHIKEEEIEKINKEIEKIKNSDTCPTCGRKYDNFNDEHLQSTIKEKNLEIDNLNNIINECNSNINEFDKQLKEIQNNKIEIEEKAKLINKNVEDRNKNIENEEIQRKILMNNVKLETGKKESIQHEINILQSKKEQILKTEINNKEEFEKMIEDIDNQLLELTDLNSVKQLELTECDNTINSVKHMLQLITKDFRTYLLKNSLNYLNKVLSEYSNQLFSNDGDIISISNDDTKLDIKLGNATYESLSGGEKTRVNIALLLAQKSLAGMIGNMNCNMIILDEILGYCDSKAETKVIDLINNELESLESIYMVSHKEIPIGCDSVITVIKDKSGLSRVKSY